MIALPRRLLPQIALAALTIAVFAASLGAPFYLDDYALLADPAVTEPGGWRLLLSLERTRPLTYLTFRLNYRIGGASPAGYHAVNLLLHVAAVLLLFGVLRRLLPLRAAWIAAFLFALHPIQTEAVVYVFARATLLMAVLCLAAWRAWLDEKPWRAAAWFAFGLLAKEECAAFPLLLLLLDRARGRRELRWRPAAAMLALAAAAGGRVAWVLAQSAESGAGAGSVYSPWEYFAAQGPVIWRYLRLLVIPYGFTVDPQIAVPGAPVAAIAWLALAAAAFAALRRFAGPGPGFWFLGGLLLLLPSSSIFPADDLAADRRMYLPLAAFAPAAALLLGRMNRKVLTAAGLALVLVTASRVAVWRSARTLWAEAVERAPAKVRPRIQLSRALEANEAIGVLEEARRLFPGDARISAELGRRYLEIGDPARALESFGRALALEPANPAAWNNRGAALLALGQREAARQDFEAALERDPCFAPAYENLAKLGIRRTPPSACAACVAPGDRQPAER